MFLPERRHSGHDAAEVRRKVRRDRRLRPNRSSIDTPVKRYSSGMYVRGWRSRWPRTWSPTILLIDEVLAVATQSFSKNAWGRCAMSRTMTAFETVLFVSHKHGVPHALPALPLARPGPVVTLGEARKWWRAISASDRPLTAAVRSAAPGGGRAVSLRAATRRLRPPGHARCPGDTVTVQCELRCAALFPGCRSPWPSWNYKGERSRSTRATKRPSPRHPRGRSQPTGSALCSSANLLLPGRY